MTTRKIMMCSFLIAIGILLQLIESLVPVAMIVPGFKIGLANLASVYALQKYDRKSMWIVSIGRIFLASFLMGTFLSTSFLLSLSGGLVALVFMSVGFSTKKFSIYGISILGAAGHSIGQVIMITFIYQQYFMQLFLPILLALSNVSGLCIGALSTQLWNRTKGV